jgi:thiol-disulfide isomerase/thioredoxin
MLAALVFLAAAAAAPPAASSSDQLVAVAKEASDISKTFDDALHKAGQNMPRVIEANDRYRKASAAWVDRARPLVLAHPAEPAALDVILAMNRLSTVNGKLIDIIREHHMSSPKVLELVMSLGQDRLGMRRSLAEEIAAKHADRSIRGRATLTLARLDRIYLVDAMKPEPSFGGRLGKPDELRTRARVYLERTIKDYADVPSDEGPTLGELAKSELAGIDNAGKLEVGHLALDITGQDLDGKPLTMTARSGRVTLLVFWGSWCGPCMKLAPREAALAGQYKDRPFAIYGVNGGDEPAKAKKAAADKKMTWPSFYGGRERGGLAAVWNVDAWPAVYVIGPDGVIRYKGYGDGMERAVEEALLETEKKAKAR